MTLRIAAHQGELPSARFGGHRHSRSTEITTFVCHVTLQEHVIMASCDFMVSSTSR